MAFIKKIQVAMKLQAWLQPEWAKQEERGPKPN